MKLWAGITGEGISLRIGDEQPERIKWSPTASQTSPKRSYIYAHYDERGVPFYVGKGTGRRAWDDSRHPLWHRYVKNHLAGKYTVVILADDMTPDEAEEAESELIAQESETLVNWINFGRKTDFAALDRYHQLRDENQRLIATAREMEKADPEQAVASFYRAMESIADYATLKTEDGLIGRLLDEEREESGYSGELVVLDRLTLCLVRLGRGLEAQRVTGEYFAKYRADELLSVAETIKRRVAKAARNNG